MLTVLALTGYPCAGEGGQCGFLYHCEFTPAGSGRPTLDETCLTVMAGLVPAIRSGRVPRLMAGTGPAMTVKVTPKANRVS
jgi:hypothetical protein